MEKIDKNQIFKKGSKTYFYSSLFFPKDIRADVLTLYSFVRVIDNFVDTIPPQIGEYERFKSDLRSAWQGSTTDNLIVNEFVQLAKNKNFDPAWTDAFFVSMEMDLNKHQYQTLDDTLKYIHGSAEIVGLMMARLFDLPETAFDPAQKLGRAMQYINFIRDINEDIQLGRNYFPKTELDRFNLSDLSETTARQNPENFVNFIRAQIERYRNWQSEASLGYRFIPRRMRIPVQTASEMYGWTADQIYHDPFIVYRQKIKPGIGRIVLTGLKNSIIS